MAIDWMEGLEDKVREAAQEIRRLRAENEELRERHARHEAAPPAFRESDAAWEQEREEVRQRVERLVRQLEGLIQEAESGDA